MLVETIVPQISKLLIPVTKTHFGMSMNIHNQNLAKGVELTENMFARLSFMLIVSLAVTTSLSFPFPHFHIPLHLLTLLLPHLPSLTYPG